MKFNTPTVVNEQVWVNIYKELKNLCTNCNNRRIKQLKFILKKDVKI